MQGNTRLANHVQKPYGIAEWDWVLIYKSDNAAGRTGEPMVDPQSVKAKVTSFIFEKFPLAQKRQFGEETSLLETGIVDSIGILEIVTFIEEKFSVQVGDDDLVPENFGSIA